MTPWSQHHLQIILDRDHEQWPRVPPRPGRDLVFHAQTVRQQPALQCVPVRQKIKIATLWAGGKMNDSVLFKLLISNLQINTFLVRKRNK